MRYQLQPSLLALIVLVISVAFPALRVVAETAAEPTRAEVLRVGGDYTVASINKIDERAFVVEFKALKPTGRYDTLRLESDHVHVAVKTGQQIRLSAEILSTSGATAEVAQVVVFFNGASGRVPVWLLSTKAPGRDLRASKYLEMHVPATDFVVM